MKNFQIITLILIISVAGPKSGAYSSGISEKGPASPGSISGTVLDEKGKPVGFAVVRIQTTQNQAVTDTHGCFALVDLDETLEYTVSAWKDEYYCAKVESIRPPFSGLNLVLRLYQTDDNPDYVWMPPTGNESCFDCKPELTQHWLENDLHAGSSTNIRFLTMYNGTDTNGNLSPKTRFVDSRDYGLVPIPPDEGNPYFGPGYKLDFPESDGNCSACHVPGAAVDAPYNTDPNITHGADQFGIHCDFCHKVAAVAVDPRNGMPYPNMPGVLSIDIRRPYPEDPERFQLFFGTFDDDNVPEEDTKLPLIGESRFCAACHYGVFWDTVIYNSYGEWLESSYSDPVSGSTCQDCHMPATIMHEGLALTNVARGQGGVERDPETIHSHAFPGAADVNLLRNSVSMEVDTGTDGGILTVSVEITNDRTGHHVPTDSPLRHLILLIDVEDPQGNPLELVDGETLPEWCGTDYGRPGHYAGQPGKAYAKILEELWTEISPSGSYWNQTRIVSDNRLAAYESDMSSYIFKTTENGCHVSVKLIYRRAFITLAEQKGWDLDDIIMAESSESITAIPTATDS